MKQFLGDIVLLDVMYLSLTPDQWVYTTDGVRTHLHRNGGLVRDADIMAPTGFVCIV